MKYLVLFITALISLCVSAQEQEKYTVRFDVNKELYPVYDRLDDLELYACSDSSAGVGASYLAQPYSDVKRIQVEMESQIDTESIKPITLPGSKVAVTGFTGKVFDEYGNEKLMEVYFLEANKGEGIIMVFSGYKVSEQAIYGAEGKKAALSAVLVR